MKLFLTFQIETSDDQQRCSSACPFLRLVGLQCLAYGPLFPGSKLMHSFPTRHPVCVEKAQVEP